MFADAEAATGPAADFVPIGAPIIPEVTVEGKELVFVIEIDLIKPAN